MNERVVTYAVMGGVLGFALYRLYANRGDPIAYVDITPETDFSAPGTADYYGLNLTGADGVSAAGVAFLEGEETWSATAYPDAGGHAIGWGHYIQPGEEYLLASTITKAQGQALLGQDLEIAENAINSAVIVPLSQNQYDALASLVYNMGVANFRKSSLLASLNAGDYTGAGLQFPLYNHSAGQPSAALTARRDREQSLFFS